MDDNAKKEMHTRLQPNEQFGDVTFVKYINKPYFYKDEKDNGIEYDYGLFKCKCGRYEVSRVNRIIYSKKYYECIHNRKLDKNTMMYGDSLSKWRIHYSNIVKKYGNENVEWKRYVQFYEFVAPRWRDMELTMKTLGMKKRVTLAVDEGADYIDHNTVKLSTEKRIREAKTEIEPQIINNIEYKSLGAISEAYDITLSTVYRRYMSGKRNEDLIA